ncbi:YciI family protein [Streptomyces sp. NRRL F-5126]|uniref:YciI family protein n=1 Tax=Streptomyces sp. NRRL F-5126 TaxID=1463857 RepID=UPI0004CB71B5|nr:YciI family protein [Streptomyces sp. NRRL F-5126]
MTNPTAPEQQPLSWNALRDLSEQKGLLAKQLFAVISTPTAGFGPITANLDPHLAYQAKLEEEGVMFAAGPLSSTDGSRWDGAGLFVYRAPSLAAAIALAEQDPMHASGARSFEVRAWMLNEGSLSVRVRYSRGDLHLE